MKSKLKILMVYSEIAPFSKTGGLGDVGGALPKALKEMGHDVRIITPQYQCINERRYILRDVIRLQNIDVPLGQETHQVNVKSAFLPDTKVQVYFIDHKPYFFRKGMYVDPKTGADYPDNAQRFALFSKGVLETLHRLHWQPDIIHCNDWQTGLIPYYLKTLYLGNPFFSQTSTLYTIHNFAFQGRFDAKSAAAIGFDIRSRGPESGLDADGGVNFLRLGIESSDMLNTVSEKHAVEVQSSPEFGFGLEKLLRSRKKQFFGIANGIDPQVWNPETDKFIPHPYNFQRIAEKEGNKRALMERFALPYKPGAPVIAMVSRLTGQKGLDLVRDALPQILSANAAFILLGEGEEAFESFFRKAAKKYPGRMGVHVGFDDPLAHLIIAGADLFLMPSRFEPSGLTQIYSLKYGTVPVVCPVGGLLDTVEPVKPRSERGTGFVLPAIDAKSLAATVKQAVKAYGDPRTWQRIQKNGMKKDFSWEASAKRYVQLYHKCLLLNKP
jgi:starch synthase